jgi:hypothetical protein
MSIVPQGPNPLCRFVQDRKDAAQPWPQRQPIDRHAVLWRVYRRVSANVNCLVVVSIYPRPRRRVQPIRHPRHDFDDAPGSRFQPIQHRPFALRHHAPARLKLPPSYSVCSASPTIRHHRVDRPPIRWRNTASLVLARHSLRANLFTWTARPFVRGPSCNPDDFGRLDCYHRCTISTVVRRSGVPLAFCTPYSFLDLSQRRPRHQKSQQFTVDSVRSAPMRICPTTLL